MIDENNVNTELDNTSVDNTSVDDVQGQALTVDSTAQASDAFADNTSVDEPKIDNTSVDNTSVDNTSVDNENIRALRNNRKKLQQERDALKARLDAIESKKAEPVKEEDYSFIDGDDKTNNEIAQLKRQYAEIATNNSRTNLNSKFPDFTKVVNDESIAILKERLPEVAATLDRGTDIYTTGVSAYNIIKKFGFHMSEENNMNKQHISNNINKPKPVNSIKSQSALANAADYSDLSDKDVRAEIIRIASERAMG